MDETFDIPKLLKHRKITNTISSYLEQELKSHITTLEPIFNPKLVLGEYISGSKVAVKSSATSFKQIQETYKSLKQSKVFYDKLNELKSPIDLFGSSLELTQYEYTYQATNDNGGKAVRVTTPLKWVLGYKNQGLLQLKDLLSNTQTSRSSDIEICILHLLAMHTVFIQRKDITKLLQALRFSVYSEPSIKYGKLPLVFITCPIKTILPPDQLIIQSTELSGMPVFEEVIDPDDINQLTDPYKEQLLKLVNNNI